MYIYEYIYNNTHKHFMQLYYNYISIYNRPGSEHVAPTP